MLQSENRFSGISLTVEFAAGGRETGVQLSDPRHLDILYISAILLNMSWKRLDRRTLVNTKFLKVYEDKVELPNGNIMDDYTVVEKPSFSMIIALDNDGNLITIDEYKYAVDKIIHTLPAGHINEGEEPLETAKRELVEETGYMGGEWENLGAYYDYPTKDLHKVYFIKATGVTRTQETKFDPNEDLTPRVISLNQLKEEIARGEWRTNAVLSALVAAKLLS